MLANRHDLITLKPDCEFRHTGDNTELVCRWIQQGFPVIYTRQTSDSSIDLGLTLMVNQQKQRIKLQVATSESLQIDALPPLAQFTDYFSQEVIAFADCHVYGSFLYAYLTQLPYITAQSDLDVLVIYRQQSLYQLRLMYQQLQRLCRRNIDGEVRFEGAGDIALRELLFDESPQLLYKTAHQAGLIKRQDLYALYPVLRHA